MPTPLRCGHAPRNLSIQSHEWNRHSCLYDGPSDHPFSVEGHAVGYDYVLSIYAGRVALRYITGREYTGMRRKRVGLARHLRALISSLTVFLGACAAGGTDFSGFENTV